MKKLIVILLAIMLFSMTPALALSWTDVEAEACTEYSLSADKYSKVNSDLGAAYEKNPNATAKVGDTVYFALSAVDTTGEPVDAEIEYHNLGNVKALGKIYSAQVVGSKPYAKISITEKTDINDLSYNGSPITITDTAVVIGDLTFTRDANGKVTDVSHKTNAAEMLNDLAALSIDVADIYKRKVCMTEDILIANFGKVCKTEATAAWYTADTMAIPKTGDASIILPVAVCAAILTISATWRKR